MRSIELDQVQSTIGLIQDEIKKVQKFIDESDQLINENVGKENVWTGQRANGFKQKWEKAMEEFRAFVRTIDSYPQKAEESYNAYMGFEQGDK